MKKLLLSFLVITVSASLVNAQIKKGSFLIGGDLSASSQTTTSSTTQKSTNKGISFSPMFGKFIKDNLVVGGNLYLSSSSSKAANENQYKSNGYGAGVFIRKYKNIGTSGFYIFAHGAASVIFSNQETVGTSPAIVDKNKGISIGATIYPGVSYAVTRRVHLETGFNNLISLSYSRNKRENATPDYKTTNLGLSSSLGNPSSAFYLGFRIILGKA